MSSWQPSHNNSTDRQRLLHGSHATGIQASVSGSQHRSAALALQQNDNLQEGFSDQRVAGLQDKVSMLREITIGIGDEVREQNRYLGEMNDDFESTGSFLDGTVKRFQRMAARQRAGGWMCYMVLFVVGSFSFMYLYVKLWRGNS